DPPRRYDDGRVTPINLAWPILAGGPPRVDRSLKGRLRGFIWRLVGPPLEAQQRFNAEIVDHINRNVAAHQEAQQATGRLLEVARDEFEALARFESLLIQFLQTITVYVDTKDRHTGASELRERLGLAEQRILALKRELEGQEAAPGGPALGPSTAGAFSANVD